MFCEMFFYVKWGTVPRFLGFWKMGFKVSSKLCLFFPPSLLWHKNLPETICTPAQASVWYNIQLLIRSTRVWCARNKGGGHLERPPGPSQELPF